MLFRVMALVKKELLTLLKDPKSRFVVIGPPIIQLIIFGYAATFDLENVPFAVYNEDNGKAGRDLIAYFEATSALEKVRTITHHSEIAPTIDSRSAIMVLHLGPDFSTHLQRREPAPLQVIIDGRNSNTALIVLNYVRNIVVSFNHDWIVKHGGDPPAAQPVFNAWYNPTMESQWFIVPGIIGLLTLVVTLLVTALTVAREREQGTFDQLLVTPMRSIEILLGKALPGFLIGCVEATFIITIAVLWFRIPLLGSLVTLYLGLFLFLLSAVGVGLMISSIAVTQQQGLLGAFLFLVPAVILSGFATPIANMPEFVQYITYADPLRYFERILRAVFLKGATLESLMVELWPMAVIGVINLGVATWLFRRRMY
jgi:ABC-2 type transport system permease protein